MYSLVIVAVFLEAALFFLKDIIIINLGITLYRYVSYFVHLVSAVLLFNVGVSVIRRQKDRELKASILAQREQDNEMDKNTESCLAVKKELDPAEIQYLLCKRNREGEPSFVRQVYGAALHQMQTMDTYQEKLNNLIAVNEAENLSDSKIIFEQCEQYICRNVRKLMNKAELSFTETGIDDPEYEQILQANENVLDKVDELMHSIVDFLNNQGDSTNEITMLDMYKSTIQDILLEKRKNI